MEQQDSAFENRPLRVSGRNVGKVGRQNNANRDESLQVLQVENPEPKDRVRDRRDFECL